MAGTPVRVCVCVCVFCVFVRLCVWVWVGGWVFVWVGGVWVGDIARTRIGGGTRRLARHKKTGASRGVWSTGRSVQGERSERAGRVRSDTRVHAPWAPLPSEPRRAAQGQGRQRGGQGGKVDEPFCRRLAGFSRV